MPPEPETAAAAFTRTGQDAVTHARRVAGEARARNQKQRGENAELIKQFGRIKSAAAEPGSGAVRSAAKRFRAANGYPVPTPPPRPESVPPSQKPAASPARSGDDEEDFSQSRIMRRGD
ncbi:hypothetical protein [Amycolatopsis sp. H20-H5]|uniref:hypothetical protein n=1 Tax=Amycolatopsis sp. H20-H5 TaxID=3046309 RepID=UPI002DB58F17|nr:hypothetical protein [Amycolatopsis sp. H20-H5]MEC3980221.1 hypothetical protein [Amycolatopsis sp. H20-H5]